VSQRATCTPYLYFKGACEQALAFYAEHGLGTVRELRRYDGTPAAERGLPTTPNVARAAASGRAA